MLPLMNMRISITLSQYHLQICARGRLTALFARRNARVCLKRSADGGSAAINVCAVRLLLDSSAYRCESPWN